MSESFQEFDDRLRRIERKRRKLANGYELHMQNDGLIVARPRRMRSAGITPRGFITFVVGFMLFKGVLIATLGVLGYEDRVVSLAQGSTVEKAGAWIMQVDPVSREIASWVSPYLK